MSKTKKKNKRIITAAAMIIIAAVFVCISGILIRMNGESEIQICCGEEYKDAGADVLLGLGTVKTEGYVDTEKPGEYRMKYSFLSGHKTRTVKVVDEEAPEMELIGPSELTVIVGSSYTDAGCSAFDNADGDLTDRIEISGMPDTSKEGEYFISYIATDSSGNAARVRRKITVTKDGPMTADRLGFDLNPFYYDVIAPFSGYDEEKYESLLYVGDSFIGNLGDHGIVPWEKIWSRGSTGTDDFYVLPLTVYGVYDGETTFFDAMDRYYPKNILIMFNNDRTFQWSPEYLMQSCDEAYRVISEKYPETKISICSINPVDAYYSSQEWIDNNGFDRNVRINRMNACMCELCRKYGFAFVNTAEAVKDSETGCCRDEYISDDGIHLSYEGYLLMVEYIKTHLAY